MSAVSTAVSSVISSALAGATSSASCSTADFTQFPTVDVACAVDATSGNLAGNTSLVLEECCKTAPVEAFNGDCGFYCLSVKQSVSDLQGCFMDGGVPPRNIFCNANNSATATGEPTKSGASSTATSGAGESSGALPGVVTPRGVSKTGLGMLCMVVVSAFAGAML